MGDGKWAFKCTLSEHSIFGVLKSRDQTCEFATESSSISNDTE